MSVPPDAVRAAAAAYHAANCPVKGCGEYSVAERRAVTAALKAAEPLIRADERERILNLSRRPPSADDDPIPTVAKSHCSHRDLP